jgi:hypothetical protein
MTQDAVNGKDLHGRDTGRLGAAMTPTAAPDARPTLSRRSRAQAPRRSHAAAISRMQWLMVLSGALALIGAVWFVWRLG